ncbi:MAG TPA: outer membrane beta-barrel protein [Flavisolibacter sp.]|nr:outer membrane beta-barrel protein [Flavisolibacter sp.]
MHRTLLLSLGLIALWQLIGATASAQSSKTTVTGTLKDSAAQKPLVYATVELFRAGQLQQPVKSVFTNDKGKFTFNAVDTGRYTLIFSHTGFAETRAELTVADQPIVLNDISLSPASSSMQNIVVTARKPLVEQTDDKIVFNVENDPASKSKTAIDILRKTPFVSVDGDNNIQVNGQSNFKVLLNGRETAMFAQNVKEALKGFPGALITKIEVITTPSAKYDAEGVGGVINIITKKKVVGYNGSISTYYASTGWYNINSNFSAKFGKVGVTVYYGAGGAKNVPGTIRQETLPRIPSLYQSRLLVGDRRFTNFWNFGNAEVSWEVDSLNTMSFYGNVSGGRNRSKLNQTITMDYTSVPDSVSYYNLDSRNEYPTNSVGADYIRKFSGNKEKEFSLRFNTEFGNSNTFLNSVMDNPVTYDRYVINNSEAVNKQYTLQSDFIQPLKNSQKIETGVKAILRRATSDFESLLRFNNLEDYKLNLDNTDFFQYDQDVYSVYGTYSFKVKKTTFRLGARMEHTEVNGDFISAKTQVNQRYSNLLPNVQASIRMSNSLTFVASYSDRLQRPYIWNLNPFKNNNDPLNISYGNPSLDAQIIHSLSLQTRINKGTTFAGLTLGGTYSDNMIVQYATFDPSTGVTSTTSDNVGKELQVSLNANVNGKITPDWSIFINGNIRYNRVENKFMRTQVNDGFGGNANLNTNYTIKKKLVLSAYAGFWKAPVSIQTSYPLNIWYGLNAGYKFFKDKLTASVGAANFLDKNWDFKLVTQDPNFTYTSTSTMPFRALSVSLTWNFGKLTENVSKKKGVNNDDLIGSGQSN